MASIETNPNFFVQDGYCSPNTKLIPLSCGIVFGVAGWTTTMKVMDENHMCKIVNSYSLQAFNVWGHPVNTDLSPEFYKQILKQAEKVTLEQAIFRKEDRFSQANL